MLNGEDPQTHQQLSEENIRYQVRSLLIEAAPGSPKVVQLVTFLIAGHETVRISCSNISLFVTDGVYVVGL